MEVAPGAAKPSCRPGFCPKYICYKVCDLIHIARKVFFNTAQSSFLPYAPKEDAAYIFECLQVIVEGFQMN